MRRPKLKNVNGVIDGSFYITTEKDPLFYNIRDILNTHKGDDEESVDLIELLH